MPRYRVIIHGRNFRLNMEGKWEKMGFYTPRFVDAPDPLLAEHTALEEFRQSPKFCALMDGTLNADDDPPALGGEDIEEVAPDTGIGHPLAGLALYAESGDERAEPNAAKVADPFVLSVTGWSILIQVAFFLLVRVSGFYPDIEPANYFTLDTLQGFLTELTAGTLWVVVFHHLFLGQLLAYVVLTILPIIFIVKAHGRGSRLVYLSLFHLCAVTWTLLPVVALRFGTYRGP